jgi:hypothetical protein
MADDPSFQESDPLGVELAQSIRNGDLAQLRTRLTRDPSLARARIVGRDGVARTLLHLVTDWPGYFRNGPAIVHALTSRGGDPNAPTEGSWHSETPLHWAASSDDVDVAEALIDDGAALETTGGSIANGTPLDNAVAYGCWRVARLLVARGAHVKKLWQAAALGMTERVAEFLVADERPTANMVNEAFWQACHGGHRRTAEYLRDAGADVDSAPSYANQTALETALMADTGRQSLADWLRAASSSVSGP